ncbi:MAG: extracellular solute-binding protein [Chloroflexota bacterium]|nr:extracellular solute-binding protein [Chloroflexota bacterium]
MTEGHPSRALFQDALAGRINRRELLQRAAALGLTAPVVGALLQASVRGGLASEEGKLNVTYYDWILSLHAPITQVDEEFGKTFPFHADVAPSAGFSTDIFVTEAKDQKSTWDLYIGVTPFLEMIQLAESGVIEPWDPYLPAGVLDDILPAMRAEGTYNGQFYVWPFLLDVIVQGWNTDVVAKAGLDPETAPKTWDEYLANAQKIKESGAANFGCTFDFHDWRSLIPIANSISTEVYNPDGTFMWTSDAAVEALEIMKRMMEYANPDVLNEGTTDAGVNGTPDEQAFAQQQVGYYIKYENAHLRFAGVWPDPTKLRLAALPRKEGGSGGTVFWDTGAVLLKYGKNKEQAANYMKALTYDQRIWEHSVTGDPSKGQTPVGQLPVYQSIWNEYKANRPAWMTDWAFAIYDGLESAKAIAPTKLSVGQFTVARPQWVKYLKSETKDAKAALQAAQDAVTTEMQKAGS